VAATVLEVANRVDRSSAQVAINWVRQRGDNIIPIIGARTEAQMAENLGALDFGLDAEQRDLLDQAAPIDPGFPHTFLADDEIHDLIFGQTWPLIDNHRALVPV
jgi:diketogulonate reductase-like aldo/keto reductase